MIQIEFVDGPLHGTVETLPDERGLTRELGVPDGDGTAWYLAWDVLIAKEDVYVQYVAFDRGPDATA